MWVHSSLNLSSSCCSSLLTSCQVVLRDLCAGVGRGADRPGVPGGAAGHPSAYPCRVGPCRELRTAPGRGRQPTLRGSGSAFDVNRRTPAGRRRARRRPFPSRYLWKVADLRSRRRQPNTAHRRTAGLAPSGCHQPPANSVAYEAPRNSRCAPSRAHRLGQPRTRETRLRANRINFIVDDIDSEVVRLQDAGPTVRNYVVTSPVGSQILVQDPPATSSNSFQPRRVTQGRPDAIAYVLKPALRRRRRRPPRGGAGRCHPESRPCRRETARTRGSAGADD